MKKVLFVLAIVVLLTSCGKKKEPAKILEEIAIEKPLSVIIRNHIPGNHTIEYEDTFYRYNVELNYIGEDVFRNTTELMPTCPVGTARYTVLEKSSGLTLKDEIIPQMPCSRCHPRR